MEICSFPCTYRCCFAVFFADGSTAHWLGRSSPCFALFGMPVLYPNGLAMSVELCVYGLAIGFIYGIFKKQGLVSVYISLVIAMILGRIVWGGSMTVLLSMNDSVFTAKAFLAGAVLNAIPGIILQLLLIPAIMTSLHATGVQRFNGHPAKEERS